MNNQSRTTRHSPFSILHSQSGFTLAELLVSISIIILFTAVLLPSFTNFGRRNELRQGAQFVQSKIMEAKSYALAPRSGGGTSIQEYEFRAPVGVSIPGCSAGVGTYAILEVTTTDTTVVVCEKLPSGLTFTTPQRSVTFSVEGQGAIIPPPPPNETTFTIEHPRLTAANTLNMIVRRATGQVTITSP